jgi:hypothetical protein
VVAQTFTTRFALILLLALSLTGCSTGPAPESVPTPTISASAGKTTPSALPESPPSSQHTTSDSETSQPSTVLPSASPRPNDGDGGADSGHGGGGLNAGTPLRIPLPQDRLTSLKLPEAKAQLMVRIDTVCGGDQCIAVAVQAIQEDPPVPGQSCEDVLGLVGMAEDEFGDPYVDAASGGSVTLQINIRCEDAPAAGPSDSQVSPADHPDPGSGGTGSENGDGSTDEPDGATTPHAPEGNSGNPNAPDEASRDAVENEYSLPAEPPGGTP